ncbi:virulence factor BrkB family protein [Seminibacterium arietis]|uniref:UPF0761 membrane protein ACFQ02_07315 n=1 Tax=Seminibacterium arietis TaxID=1173502 RepID=A0ABW3IAI7_9PAST
MHVLCGNIKIFFNVLNQRVRQNKLTQAAGYLTYSTMLALVPLIMVMFSIFSAFPVFNEVTDEIKHFIFANFAPATGDVVGEYLDQFVANSKQMSAVGTVSLIAVALMLINSIDRTLNSILRGGEHRPLMFSFAVYWLILTLGPLIVALSIGISSYVATKADQVLGNEIGIFGIQILSIVPFILTWFIFTLIYTIVPTKKVSIKHSMVGALVAAIFFTLGKQAFTWYITHFPSYQLIYGAMATLPIMLLWIYLSWTVVLIGAQISATLDEIYPLHNVNQDILE